MLDRFKNASRAETFRVVRKTTEVTVDATLAGPHDPLALARASEPALILLHGDLPGQVFRLQPGRQLIGRRPECEIRLRERAVSGIHAEIIRTPSGVTINDLESTNGTLVNGARIRDAHVLTHGSLLRVGNCVFKYVDSLLDVEFTESLHNRGITDQLTSTFNQTYLVARLGFCLDTAGESRPVSIITFDFDEFKAINDQHGHPAGDHVLRSSCALIRETCLRAGDLFARMGGEEFVIVLPETPLARAAEIAEEMRKALEERAFDWNEQPIRLTASFGVCVATSAAEPPEAVLSRADELLYRSKREGRNRVTA